MSPPQDRTEPSLDERLAMRRRPRGWRAGYQEWRRLLFVHWAVAPDVLRPLVPPPLDLDLFEGMAYVGLVPFVVRTAIPPGYGFLETNVRTYVHVNGHQPGVYFFSLDAASVLAVLGARLAVGLPYFLARGRVRDGEYRLRRLGEARATCQASYEVGQPLGPAEPGSLDFFLIERYLLHTVRRVPSLWSVQVNHEPYPLHAVQVEQLAQTLTAADGLPPLTDVPLAHYSPGVDVKIFPPRVQRLR